MSSEHEFDGHGGHMPGCAKCCIEQLEAALDAARNDVRLVRAGCEATEREVMRQHRQLTAARAALAYYRKNGWDVDNPDFTRDTDTIEARIYAFEAGYEAALAAREAEVAGPAWQPIETAPKDGTVVLVWLGDADESDRDFYCVNRTGLAAGGWQFLRGKWRPENGLTLTVFVQPTHWMPLPSPPQPAPDTEACR